MKKACVEDLMTTDVVSVYANDDAATLYDLMFENHIRHLPVVDDEGNIVGLVSHRDLLGAALCGSQSLPVTELRQLLRSIQVREIMVTGVQTVSPSDDLEEAAQLLLENKYGCLPVTDGTYLVGILTESDFVRRVIELEQQERARKNHESELRAI